MGLMYNSLCVLTHPQRPWGSPQCITVKAELHSVLAWGVLLSKKSSGLHNTHSQWIKTNSNLLCANAVSITPTTQKYKYTNTPFETVATAQINTNAWPWMSLAVTAPPPLIWKRSNWSTPYQPLILKRPSFHYHWSAVCLCVYVCVWEREGERWRGVCGYETQRAK